MPEEGVRLTPPRIALVTHSISGGVWSTVQFLRAALQRSGEFASDVFTVATSFNDEASLQLVNPFTWFRAPRVVERRFDEARVRHVGAVLSEFEVQRYKPRQILTSLLEQYDLVQVVGGSPAWGQVAQHVHRPVCLFAATTSAAERVAALRASRPMLRAWRMYMTRLATRAEDRALAKASAIFAESKYTRGLLEARTNPGVLHLAPPGVDVGFFRPCTSPDRSGAIISVGRLQDPRKNVRLLLRAYAMLQKRRSLPPLHLVGRGGLSTSDWQFVQELGIADRVKVFRDVSLAELRDLYQASSLFVLPSDEEGLGIVILEAMACGLPVISTDCGGPATAIVPHETGLLTPVGHAGSLASAIRLLLDDVTLRRRMGVAGRRRAEREFSIERAGALYLKVYRDLLV